MFWSNVEDDLGGLRNIRLALKSGGRAIILVPHDQRLFGTLDVALGHHRRYSREQLTQVRHGTVGFSFFAFRMRASIAFVMATDENCDVV